MDTYGHSANVRMELHVHGQVLAIGHLGPDFIILDAPSIDHPPTEAEIAMSIDGRPRRWLVHLPDGISAGRLETRIGQRS